MNLKQSKLKGKKTTKLKRILLRQEPEFYSNSLLLSTFIKFCSFNGKMSVGELIFYKISKKYKLKHKFLVQLILLNIIEKMKPAFLEKIIHRQTLAGANFVPSAPQRTNYTQKYQIAARWLVEGLCTKKGKSFFEKLFKELEILNTGLLTSAEIYKKGKQTLETLTHPLNEKFMRYRFTRRKKKNKKFSPSDITEI